MGEQAAIKYLSQPVWHDVMDRRLQWLGHLGRMEDERLLKKMLYGELREKRPCHGLKKR